MFWHVTKNFNLQENNSFKPTKSVTCCLKFSFTKADESIQIYINMTNIMFIKRNKEYVT